MKLGGRSHIIIYVDQGRAESHCESGLQVTFSRVISVGTVWINGRSAVRNYKREIVKSYEFQQFGVCFPVFAPLFGVLLRLPAVAPESGAGFG
ncbi:MAG: hypothetical protein ACLSV7_10785 [Oscillospiraceae bacterium]